MANEDVRKMAAQVATVTKKLDALSDQFTQLTRWAHALRLHLPVSPVAFCVILYPGHCHTFPSAPNGKLTIENATDQAGSVSMSWGDFNSAGEVQQTSTREAQPTEWPATICNTGTVPLTVCPA